MSGYCSLQATSRPSCSTARCTCPRLAAAAAVSPNSENLVRQSGPSSPPMRRRTNAAPIAGAFDCSCASSCAYSAGSASGTVERNCATFISGPFSPPRMAFRSSACAARSVGCRRRAPRPRAPRCRRPPRRCGQCAAVRRTATEWSSASAITSARQLVDEARDHVEPARPERRVGRIQPERRQQLLVPLGAAGAQHVQVLRLEARMPVLEHRIQRVHQAIAERIGIDVERRVDEVRHIGPEHTVFRA